MNRIVLRHAFVAAIASVAFTGAASAKYLCDEPPSAVDRRACQAAEEGPAALRRFIERIRPVHNLYFHDYVNEARLLAWQELEAVGRRQFADTAAKTASTAGERR